jgi:hypothetical protein
LKALLARKKQCEGPKSCLEYLGGAAGPKKQFEGPQPRLEYLEGAAGSKGQFEGPKSCLEYLEGAAGPKEQFEGPKSCLEYLEGAAGPKGQFEGPKSCLEYLEGAAGPKGQFEGPKSCLEYLEGAAGPKGQFEGPKSCLEYLEGVAGPKNPIQNVQQRTESSKNSTYVWVTQERETQNPRREPSQKVIRVQGAHTFETRKNSYQSLPFEPKRNQATQKIASLLTMRFIELSHHPLQEWPDPAKTRRIVGPPAARPGR